MDNLPVDMDEDWLSQLFSKHGLVLDTFIPRKRSKRFGTKFGFIRFKTRDEALEAIADLNGLLIRGRRILVKFAAFETTGGKFLSSKNKFIPKIADLGAKSNHRGHWVQSSVGGSFWVPKSNAEMVTGRGDSDPPIKLLELGNEWLQRSATAKLSPSRSMILVQDQLASLGFVDIQVRPMGGDHVVLTFPSIEDRD